jgi:hypothetical protein
MNYKQNQGDERPNSYLHTRRRENLKSHLFKMNFWRNCYRKYVAIPFFFAQAYKCLRLMEICLDRKHSGSFEFNYKQVLLNRKLRVEREKEDNQT